jgi:hypothetical protein
MKILWQMMTLYQMLVGRVYCRDFLCRSITILKLPRNRLLLLDYNHLCVGFFFLTILDRSDEEIE